MKAWTRSAVLAAMLTLAGCAEDAPGSMTEAEPETFDAGTVYEIVPVGGSPTQPGAPLAVFVQFDSEKAKRALAEALAEDAAFQLAALSAARTVNSIPMQGAPLIRRNGWSVTLVAPWSTTSTVLSPRVSRRPSWVNTSALSR